MRIQIYNWFGRWLKGETKTIEEEPDSTMEPESMLFVAPSGSVVRSFHSETPFSMNRKRTVVKSPAPLDTLLALDRPPKAPAATLSRASFRDARIEAVEFAAAPGVCVPAWLFLPKQPEAIKSVVITLEPSGRTSWHENEVYDRLAAAGAAVCAPDLRGIGDLTPEFGRHSARNAREHANDEMWAWSSLVLGKPLAGQRIADLLAVVHGLRARPDLEGKSLVLAARGFPTVPALFAAALEPEIDRLYLAGGLVSFQSIVDTEDYDHPFGNFVPNLLLHTDLPELAASLAPRRVVIAGAVDGAGKTMSQEDVRKQYAGASHVDVLPDALWNPASILGGGQS
jgi:hypothetical protein